MKVLVLKDRRRTNAKEGRLWLRLSDPHFWLFRGSKLPFRPECPTQLPGVSAIGMTQMHLCRGLLSGAFSPRRQLREKLCLAKKDVVILCYVLLITPENGVACAAWGFASSPRTSTPSFSRSCTVDQSR